MDTCGRDDCLQHEGGGCRLGRSNPTECPDFCRGVLLKKLMRLEATPEEALRLAEEHYKAALQMSNRAAVQLENAKRFVLETSFLLDKLRILCLKQELSAAHLPNSGRALTAASALDSVLYCTKCEIETKHTIRSVLECSLCAAIHELHAPKMTTPS